MNTLYIVLGIVLVIAAWLAASYNGLIRLKNQAKEAWSDIDVQTKRRYDLIPNLVEAVKGYASHERELFEKVTAARTAAMGATGAAAKAVAENALAGTLKSLFAVAEAYPDLKANQSFLALQEELAGTVNKIGFSRQYYNDAAMRYKNRVEIFPSNILAGMYGFQPEPFFQIEEAGERAVPRVGF